MPETGNVVCVEDFFATIESYLNKEQVEFVRKAYDVAAEAHASQRRKSGEPYIIHLIAAPAGRTDLGGSFFA